MRFVVYARDVVPAAEPGRLDRSTSVDQVKAQFFDALRMLGPVAALDEHASTDDLTALCAQPDTMLAYVHADTGAPVHTRLQQVPRRALWHSLGGLMLPDRIATLAARSSNRINLVMTPFQRERLEQSLGAAVRGLGVMPFPIDANVWRPPSPAERAQARTALGVPGSATHLVYAGRFLVTKGLCQVLNALASWPLAKAIVTFAGAAEPSFPLQALSTDHAAFPAYVARHWRTDLVPPLRVVPPHDAHGLRQLLWSADAFIAPSWHEDENFGITPRQAALCGVPPVVTDFGGLADLARHLPWGGVQTYPTAVGVRFSLRELREGIDAALAHSRTDASWIDRVRASCDAQAADAGLRTAIGALLAEPLQSPVPAAMESRIGIRRIFEHADPRLVAAITSRPGPPPDGLFAPGTGPHNPEFPGNEFFAAVQGIYTTEPQPPLVVPGSSWRGFFPCALDAERRAVVEDGYPGPRVWPLAGHEWAAMKACVDSRYDALRLTPATAAQCEVVQPLVMAGMLVPDETRRLR